MLLQELGYLSLSAILLSVLKETQLLQDCLFIIFFAEDINIKI